MLRKNILILLFFCFPLSVMADEPDFALPDLNGKIHHLSDYRGKWVVVNYWATWCPPCLEEIPELESFYKAHGNKAVVIGVNYEDNDPGSLKEFVQEHTMTYPILQADLERMPPFGRIRGLPTSFIVSPQGKLVQTRLGGVTRQYLESVIKQLAKQNNTMVAK